MNALTKTLPIFSALALMATSANAAPITGSSYSADIAPGGSVWNDAGGDPTVGVAWGSSELFDSTIDTSGASSVVGWNGAPGSPSTFPTLTFDLGALYDVQTVDLWQRPNNGTINSIDVSVSTDDVTYSAVTNYVPSWSSSTDQLDLSAFANARYVKMYFVSTDWAMLSEVAFDGTLVPEPGSLALLGLGGLLIARRRRA